MKRSLALAVCGFSLVLALVGGWLADRQFTTALDTLADQAVLQHQRNLFGYADTLQEVKADDSPHMILADDSGTRYINASDKAFAGQLYFDRQRLIVGSVPCTFALLDQTGRVIYSKLPDTIPESELAALKDADPTTMRLCGQTLLLCDQVAGASGQRVWVWMVTALDASSAYAVRTATLRQWFLLQAVLTLAALLMVHHTTALQQLNDRQSRFVADLTHELKTPLTSMIGYADLLRGGELPPENQRRAADAIYHESTRLESLSQQLLSLQDLRQEALTLTAVPVAAAFEDVARSLPDCPVTLEKTCPEDAAVRADRVLLADLLRNLVLNAAHASAPGSTVTLRCLPAGDRWRLEVADTGCGIPPEALPHLTEPFYRVDKARARANGGSGVGLALCADIAAAFGAKLEFTSTVGEGTTVALPLPKEVYPHEEADDLPTFLADHCPLRCPAGRAAAGGAGPRPPAGHRPAPPRNDRRNDRRTAPGPDGPRAVHAANFEHQQWVYHRRGKLPQIHPDAGQAAAGQPPGADQRCAAGVSGPAGAGHRSYRKQRGRRLHLSFTQLLHPAHRCRRGRVSGTFQLCHYGGGGRFDPYCY